MRRALGALALLAGSLAFAEAPWETVSQDPYTIRTRPREGSEVNEYWAEGELDAPLARIQEVLLDSEAHPKVFDYIKQVKRVVPPDERGSYVVYTLTEAPLVDRRDYVIRVWVDSKAAPDGSGEFKSRWQTVPTDLPTRAGVVRMKLVEGSWHVTQRPDGKCHAVYRFALDAGGWVPSFAKDIANRKGVAGAMRALEKEARRRAEQGRAR